MREFPAAKALETSSVAKLAQSCICPNNARAVRLPSLWRWAYALSAMIRVSSQAPSFVVTVWRKYLGLTSPGAFNHRLTVSRAKPVRLAIWLIVNLSRIFMRLTLPNMSTVIISVSCLIIKQVI